MFSTSGRSHLHSHLQSRILSFQERLMRVAFERLWSLVRLGTLIHIPVLSIVGGLGDAVVSDRTHIMLYEMVL